MGGGSVLIGCDLSRWQAGVYAGSDAFVGVKATEGNSYLDPAWSRHVAAVRARGAILGPYHFARPDLGNSPESEADWFARIVEAAGGPGGMWPALDLEVGSGNLASWRDRFCARLQSRWGSLPWWYSYSNFVQTRGLNVAHECPFWLAWPDSNGRLPSLACGPVRTQQYGLKSVPGIVGNVDANRFFGSLDELRALTVGGGGEDIVTQDQFDTMLRDSPLFREFLASAFRMWTRQAYRKDPGPAPDPWKWNNYFQAAHAMDPAVGPEQAMIDFIVGAKNEFGGDNDMPVHADQLPPAGPAGPPGPPGPAVGDDHIAEVALAAVKAAVEAAAAGL